MKKGKKILALLTAGMALLGGMAFAGAAEAEPVPQPQSSSQSLKDASQKEGVKTEEKEIHSERQKEEKEILLHREEKAKKRAESARRRPNLLASTSKGSNLQSEETEDASVIGGGQWTGGEVNSSAASFSTSPSTSIPSSNSVTLQISSGLYWVPFYFEGGQIPTTSSGALDVNQVKSWIESGNFASGAYIGLGGVGTQGLVANSTGTPVYESPLFGGVDPKTGDLLSGGITATNSSYFSNTSAGAQTFEAFALSQCESNSSLSGGVKTDTLLGALSTSPSSCLEAFQKNAEAVVKINGTSYDLLSYSGIQSLLSVLAYSIPSNSATGYQGPGYLGPVTVTVGLSPALMYLFANYSDSFFGQSLVAGSSLENESFSYQVDVYKPDSSQTGYVKGNGLEWIFNPSLYQANFKAVAEDGEPLKEIYITVTANTYSNLYIAPGYWDLEDLSNSALSNYYNNLEPLANPSSYKYFGWVNSTNGFLPLSYQSPGFVLDSISGEPGEFSLPKLPSGTYSISASWFNDAGVIGTIGGSSYEDPTFNITLGSNGETISPQGDSDGFIDPSTRTVVMEAHNPFAEVLNSEGEAEESPDISLQYGKEHTFAYQLQTYLPYSAPFSLSFDPGSSYGIDLSDAKVAGIPISDLESHGLTLSGDTVTLNSAAISYIAQNGFMPATYTSPGGKDKLSSQGMGARIFSIEVPTWLTSSFKAGNAVSYTFSYSNSVSGQSGQTITGSLDDEDANNGWFKAEGEDGEPLSELTLGYREYTPAYVQEESIETLTLSSSPTDPGLFVFPPELLPCQYIVWVGIPEASYYSTYEFGGTGAYAMLFDFSPQYNAAGIGFSELGVSTPPFVDASSRTVVANVQSPSSQILTPSDKVDASFYPTETVGKSVPFTYQAQIFFSTFPASFTSSDFPSYTQQILIGEPSGVTVFENPSDIDVAGIPLSALEAKGASVSFDEANEVCPDDAEGSCAAAILISLPSSLISYISSHGYKPATESNSAGTVPLNGSFGQLSVTFRAYLDASKGIAKSPSIWEGYEYQQGGYDGGTWNVSNIHFYFDSFSPPQVYTNGPADDCAPSSLAMPSSPSSSTGLQFQSLWWGSGAPAKGAKFTVQNENEGSPYYGEYLNGDPSDFTGWSWSKSPQDFSQSTSQAIFSFGGLADGTYTVTEVDPATGATPPSSLSFTGNLSYSSPESLKAASDPMNLLSPAQRAVYFVVVPSSLPLTGGKGIPALALAAAFLAALGAGVWVGLRRRGHSPSSKRHGF